MSHTEISDTQTVLEKTLLEQQFYYLLLELNQDTQDENFNCQEECNLLTEEYILSTSGKSKSGYYHLQCTHRKHQNLRRQSLHHIWR